MGLLDNTTPQEYYDSNDHGNYQFVSLKDIINQFMMIYVGEDKIIPRAKRTDVAFHAQRALAELSFDTFKSCKSQEITVPATLQMALPQDYVNYTKISYIDDSGIKHPLYPTKHTSNPKPKLFQNADGDFVLKAIGTLNGTNTVVLDTEYKDIRVGMKVTGPYIPQDTFVDSTTLSGGITTVYLENNLGAPIQPTDGVDPISNEGSILYFSNADGSLIKKQKSSYVATNLSWNTNDFKITGTASDFANVEIGMIVSHAYFPTNTVVVNVYDTTVVVSHLPTLAVSSGQINFISLDADSETWTSYKSTTPSENINNDYDDDMYWPLDGERYGIEPSHAQINGSFYIDCVTGKIHFSSNISGKTVILDYISDSLGTDAEMQVHKFAEDAMYKCIVYAMAAGSRFSQGVVPRLKRERFAAIRNAKIRLSNLKIEELTQIFRGKSKQIKH